MWLKATLMWGMNLKMNWIRAYASLVQLSWCPNKFRMTWSTPVKSVDPWITLFSVKSTSIQLRQTGLLAFTWLHCVAVAFVWEGLGGVVTTVTLWKVILKIHLFYLVLLWARDMLVPFISITMLLALQNLSDSYVFYSQLFCKSFIFQQSSLDPYKNANIIGPYLIHSPG